MLWCIRLTYLSFPLYKNLNKKQCVKQDHTLNLTLNFPVTNILMFLYYPVPCYDLRAIEYYLVIYIK